MPPEDYNRRPTAEEIREDRIATAYCRAFACSQEAAEILAKGRPHSDLSKLARAAESLNAYLTELEH